MKKILPLLVVVVLAVGAWVLIGGEEKLSESGETKKASASLNRGEGDTPPETTTTAEGGTSVTTSVEEDLEEDEDYGDFDDRPAAEIYSSSDEALAAIREGAKDYDDLVLEQFTEPGDDCTWCDDFYTSITTMMLAESASEDERSYYAEVLAISGRAENIKTLVQSVIDSGDSELADIYAESLELTIGGDEVVNLLAGYLDSENELLQESTVAAVTNQGSQLAAETLYNHTVKVGDPDGYYSLGIGLAELIPEDDTLPYLDDLAKRRDKYSHLAVKALLNQGLDGTRRVIEILSTSEDQDFDRKMLEDAIDHVNYEEEIEEYLKSQLNNNSPVVQKFVKEVLEDFDIATDEDLES